MPSEKMQDALNDQFNAELYSAYLYLSMSAYFSTENLPGFASWMRVQRLEEITHAMKFYDYVIESGLLVRLRPIEAPPAEWESPIEAFKAVLEHERKVTGLIDRLVELAVGEGDRETETFLEWFVDEQVEEEFSAGDVASRIERVKDSPDELAAIDEEMAQRAFKPQADGIHGGVG